MRGLGNGGRRLGRGAGAFVVAIGCSGALATAASAATMSVDVTPGTIHKRQNFHIKIQGSYSKSEITARQAYLLAFVQYTTRPCKSDATKEKDVAGSPFTNMNAGKPPRFGWDFRFKAGNRLGSRRVCAYLYPKKVNPGDNVAVLKRASAAYRVT
jgi:hypothetical protein